MLELRSHCPREVAVCADPDLLRRVIANLLDNAIKFTAAGSVAIEVTATDREVEISPSDTGPGIPADHHAPIFDDLVRLPRDAGAAAQGHGLGLGIVRRAAWLPGVHRRERP